MAKSVTAASSEQPSRRLGRLPDGHDQARAEERGQDRQEQPEVVDGG